MHPGNVSAFGLLTVDLKNDYVATSVQRHDRLDLALVQQTFARLEDQARCALASADLQLVRSADLRYFGQAWEVRVEVPDGLLDAAAAEAAVERFHAAHARTYGYSYADSPDQSVEWVNLRVTGVQPLERPSLPRLERRWTDDIQRALSGTRRVWFDSAWTDTPLYARDQLQPDDCVPGPAIIEEFGSTTVVLPGLQATVDPVGNLLLEPRR
jgi:N-methylhydantoinase A